MAGYFLPGSMSTGFITQPSISRPREFTKFSGSGAE